MADVEQQQQPLVGEKEDVAEEYNFEIAGWIVLSLTLAAVAAVAVLAAFPTSFSFAFNVSIIAALAGVLGGLRIVTYASVIQSFVKRRVVDALTLSNVLVNHVAFWSSIYYVCGIASHSTAFTLTNPTANYPFIEYFYTATLFMTLTGAEGAVPTSWYAKLLVSVQSIDALISIVGFVIPNVIMSIRGSSAL